MCFVALVIQGGAMAKFWPLHHYNQCMGGNRRKTLSTARGRGGVLTWYFQQIQVGMWAKIWDMSHLFVCFVALVIGGGAMAKFWPLHHYNQCMGENRRKTLSTARGRGGVSTWYFHQIQVGMWAKLWDMSHLFVCFVALVIQCTIRFKKTPIYYGELYSDFPQRLCTCIIPQMQKTCTILAGTKYSKISSFYKKGHPLRVEDTYIWRALQWLSTETVYLHYSTNAEGMHYSSWEVSRESQSSPLRFFVESNATDHQEVSFFFSEKKSVIWGVEPATWSLESCHLTTPPPWPIYFIIIICIIYSCPQCSIQKIGHPQPLESLHRL